MFAIASQCVVLIVEDDPDTAEMLERYLVKRKLAKHTIKSVKNGLSALESIEQDKPCSIIIDEAIPGMSGLDLLRQIRARPEYHNVAIFFYSGNYEWRKQMEAEALGARGWYVKGVSRLQDLLDQVVEACGGDGEPEEESAP